jgi:pyridoxal/pyridoxine/pyridoxamine kinase
VKASAWLKEIEKSFEIKGTGDAQKTVFAAYLLKEKPTTCERLKRTWSLLV